MMNRLIPKLFYDNMGDALDLFADCMGFRVLHRDATLAVVERDSAKAYPVESAAFAAKDRPEIAIETDAIEQLCQEILARRPEMLHPNSNVLEKKPWGAVEFAIPD